MAATASTPSITPPELSETVVAMVQGKEKPGIIATAFQEHHPLGKNVAQFRAVLVCAAVKYDHLELLRFLVESRFDASVAPHRWNGHDKRVCPLQVAVEAGKTEAVEVLLQNGPPEKDELFKSPHELWMCDMGGLLEIVFQHDSCDVLAKLVPHCDGDTLTRLLRSTCRRNVRACFEYLLNNSEVDMKPIIGTYGLLWAAVDGDSLYCTQRLIQCGLDPSLSTVGGTLLHRLWCRSDDSITILKTLLNTRKINLHFERYDRLTALEIFFFKFALFLNLQFQPMVVDWLEDYLSQRRRFQNVQPMVEDWLEDYLSQMRRFQEMVRIFLENDAAEQATRVLPVALVMFCCCAPKLRSKDDDKMTYVRVLPEQFAVCYDIVRLLLAKGAKFSSFKASMTSLRKLWEICPPRVHRRGPFFSPEGALRDLFATYTAPEVIIKTMTTESWVSFRAFPEETVDMVTAKMEAVFRLLLNHGAMGVEPSTFVTLLTQDPDRYVCFLDLYLDTLPLPEQRSYMEGMQSELDKKTLESVKTAHEYTPEVLKPLQKALQERHEVCLSLKYTCRCHLLLSARGERQQFVKALPLPEFLKDYMLGVKSVIN